MDKLEKWNLIKAELQMAYQLLPTNVKQSDFGYRKCDFLEYIQNNELRLAMEELDGVIEDNQPPSSEFWQHLVNAAQLMGSPKEQGYRLYLNVT